MTQWKCSFQKFCWQLSFQCGKLVLKPLFLTRRGERSNLVQTDTLSAWISHKLPHRTFVIQPFFFTLGKKKFFFLPTFNRDLTSTYQIEYYLVIVAWCFIRSARLARVSHAYHLFISRISIQWMFYFWLLIYYYSQSMRAHS